MVTLNTIVYGDKWRNILSLDSWFFKFKSKFISKKLITVNNISSVDEFLNISEQIKKQIDFDIIYVDDLFSDIIKIFNLNLEKTNTCYNYLFPNLSTILSCKSKFLLHISEDCMHDIKLDDKFIKYSMQEIEKKKCLSTTLPWTKDNKKMTDNFTVAQLESKHSFDYLNLKKIKSCKFSYRLNFADHLYFSSIDKLMNVDYNIRDNIDGFYNGIYKGPDHSGGSFEQRISDFNVKHHVFNCVFEDDQYYIHDGKYF